MNMAKTENYSETVPAANIDKTFGAMRFIVKDDTAYTDKETKQQKISKAKISIQVIGSEYPMTLTATSLVGLYHEINDNADLRAILRARMAAENPIVKTI